MVMVLAFGPGALGSNPASVFLLRICLSVTDFVRARARARARAFVCVCLSVCVCVCLCVCTCA